MLDITTKVDCDSKKLFCRFGNLSMTVMRSGIYRSIFFVFMIYVVLINAREQNEKIPRKN